MRLHRRFGNIERCPDFEAGSLKSVVKAAGPEKRLIIPGSSNDAPRLDLALAREVRVFVAIRFQSRARRTSKRRGTLTAKWFQSIAYGRSRSINFDSRRKNKINIIWLASSLGPTACSEKRMDKISTIRRRANMVAIRSKNTRPEIAVRQFLFRNGLRFRLHAKALPGRPDIVIPSRQVAIFVHGCFWHGCNKCIDGRRKVKSNVEYWTDKVLGNKQRDRRNTKALRDMGWVVLTIWECEVAAPKQLLTLLDAITRCPKQ